MGSPAPLRLVELGPGRGTLMRDVLRAARAVPPFLAAASVHLVEISAAFAGSAGENASVIPAKAGTHATLRPRLARCRRSPPSRGDVSVEWHEAVDEVPEGAGDCHRQRVPRCASYPAAGVRRRGVVRACGRGRWARRAAICGRARGDRRDGSAGTIAARRNNSRAARRARTICLPGLPSGSSPSSRSSSTTVPRSRPPATPCRPCIATPGSIRSPDPALSTSRPTSSSRGWRARHAPPASLSTDP